MRTRREQWDAFVRYVNHVDTEVKKGSHHVSISDAWALIDMDLENMQKEELSN